MAKRKSLKKGEDPGYKPRQLEARSANQKAYIRSMDANPITFCTGPAGSGKAQPLDSNILTPNGYKRFGDIGEGDEVITQDGSTTFVTGVFPQGTKKVFQVTFSDNTSVECCGEHLWKVRKDNSKWSVKSLFDIIETNNTTKNYEIPLVEPIVFTDQEQIIDPYLLGLLIGDGGLTQDTPRFTNSSQELIEVVKSLLPEGHTLNQCADGITYQLCDSDSEQPLSKDLKLLKLFGKKSTEKVIPDHYLYASSKQRLSLLQGLLDTDGSFFSRTLEFSTSSEHLAPQVCFLVQSFGGKATVSSRVTTYTYKGKKLNGARSYRIRIVLPGGIEPFRLSKKKNVYQPNKKYKPKRFIRSIVEIGSKECQCISVAHTSHLYITDNCTVTHNTHCAIGMAIQMIRREQLERIIISRPLVGVGKDMGYLPGDILDKVGPYIVPYFDELGHYLSISMIGMWQNSTPPKIEVVPLSMMRGRTFNDTFVILDEAQNAVHAEMKTLLTRMGDNSRLVICGDRDQSDLPEHTRGAMSDAIDRLVGGHIDGIDHVEMGSEDIVRSPLLAEIIKNLW